MPDESTIDRAKAAKARYRASVKGRATEDAHRRKRQQTPECKAYMKKYLKEYGQRPAARDRDNARYHNDPKRRESAIDRGKERWRDPAMREQKQVQDYARNAKHKYGLTMSELEAMAKRQRNRCAVCGKKKVPGAKLVIDHCHKTGKVRGLLCRNCNTALGLAGDQREAVKIWADSALRYLEGKPNAKR